MRRPIIVGIVGDSASGKTTISDGLVKLLGADRITHVCTDDYHRYDRRERAERNLTALHPDCNYLDILELHLERLHFGQPILKPVYDHADGQLKRPEYIKPREFVIVEGLLGFYTPIMRQFYDVKVFLDPAEELRYFWKVRRDVAKRGYTTEQVHTQLATRAHDSRLYIQPQRQHADIVVSFYPPEGSDAAAEGFEEHLNARLTLRPTIPHPDLSYLWDDNASSAASNAGIRLHLGRDERRPVDILEIDGIVSSEHAEALERAIWQHLPDLQPLRADQFGYFHDHTRIRHSDPLALTQLLLVYHLLRKYSDFAELPFASPVLSLSHLFPSEKNQKRG